MNTLPKSRSTDIVVQEAGKELLIYDLKINKVYSLNETSKIIYQSCDGQTSFNELKAKHNLTDDLILLAINDLRRENLLEDMPGFSSNFNGLSRRETIKKVGLTTMIALPVITSLIAPKAVYARSCSGPGQANSGDIILSGGTPFCSPDQAVCNSAATANANGCCSGAAVLEFNNTDCGGSDPANVCRCV